jgi:hypothetical protein
LARTARMNNNYVFVMAASISGTKVIAGGWTKIRVFPLISCGDASFVSYKVKCFWYIGQIIAFTRKTLASSEIILKGQIQCWELKELVC